MKNSLILFYLKIALAIGIPLLGVAAIIAAINNEQKVNQEEVHIIENKQSQSSENNNYQENESQSSSNSELGEYITTVTESVTTEIVGVPGTTEEPTVANGDTSVTQNPTEPGKIEPTTQEPTEPGKIEPTTQEPTKPEPSQTQPIETTGNYEVKYTYDFLGRLVKAEHETYIIEYIYDVNGNILEIKKK